MAVSVIWIRAVLHRQEGVYGRLAPSPALRGAPAPAGRRERTSNSARKKVGGRSMRSHRNGALLIVMVSVATLMLAGGAAPPVQGLAAGREIQAAQASECN